MAVADCTVQYRLIPGFPRYRVGDDGSVWRCRKKIGSKRQVLADKWARLKPSLNDRGYFHVTLYRDDRPHYRTVHALVLEAFVGPRPKGAVTRHLNGDPADNRPSNLCWGNLVENAADKTEHGRTPMGTKHYASKLTDEDVLTIRARRAVGESVTSLAAEYGVARNAIRCIIIRQTWKHVG